MVSVLVIGFILIYLNTYFIIKNRSYADGNVIYALPYTIAIYSGLLFLATEGLSLIKGITYTNLLIFWIVVIGINVLLLILFSREKGKWKGSILDICTHLKNNRVAVALFSLFCIAIALL